MPTKTPKVELNLQELRELADFAAQCAYRVLPGFEQSIPNDPRPRNAIDAAVTFANGGERTQVLRSSAWAAFKAAQEAGVPSAGEAARAAMHAAGAAFLHPLASAQQVKHILGAAAHAARAAELEAGGDQTVGIESCKWAIQHAPASVVAILARYPAAPVGGRRVGELLRHLDHALRHQ